MTAKLPSSAFYQASQPRQSTKNSFQENSFVTLSPWTLMFGVPFASKSLTVWGMALVADTLLFLYGSCFWTVKKSVRIREALFDTSFTHPVTGLWGMTHIMYNLHVGGCRHSFIISNPEDLSFQAAIQRQWSKTIHCFLLLSKATLYRPS